MNSFKTNLSNIYLSVPNNRRLVLAINFPYLRETLKNAIFFPVWLKNCHKSKPEFKRISTDILIYFLFIIIFLSSFRIQKLPRKKYYASINQHAQMVSSIVVFAARSLPSSKMLYKILVGTILSKWRSKLEKWNFFSSYYFIALFSIYIYFYAYLFAHSKAFWRYVAGKALMLGSL